jgi:hypothetical protein
LHRRFAAAGGQRPLIDDRLVPTAEVGKGRYAPTLPEAIDAGLRLKVADRPHTIADWWGVLSGLSGDEAMGASIREMVGSATRGMAEPLGAEGRAGERKLWLVATVVAPLLVGGRGVAGATAG